MQEQDPDGGHGNHLSGAAFRLLFISPEKIQKHLEVSNEGLQESCIWNGPSIDIKGGDRSAESRFIH
jgi:hypothetical protein